MENKTELWGRAWEEVKMVVGKKKENWNAVAPAPGIR